MIIFISMAIGFLSGIIVTTIICGYLLEDKIGPYDNKDIFWDDNDGHCLICKEKEADCNCNKTEDYAYGDVARPNCDFKPWIEGPRYIHGDKNNEQKD
jgi:hypothetical protein